MIKYLTAILLLIPAYAHSFECTKKIDEISKEYSISIRCKLKSKESNFSFKQASQNMIDKSENAVVSFVSSFNKDFLNKKINNINLVYDIKAWDSSVSGMSDGKNIWVSLDDYSDRRRDKIYLQILHHEFSSNVFKSVDWVTRIQWRDINYAYDLSWSYLKKCLSEFKFAEETTEAILKNGFLKNYSLTNDENDFNIYAEYVFTDIQTINELKNKYPLIKTKLEKFKQFYRETGFIGKFPDET